jgi:hypothetical protein
MLPRSNETRMVAVSPKVRLVRLGEVDRRLLMLLLAQGVEAAKSKLSGLTAERRELLAPLVAELAAMPAQERREILAALLIAKQTKPVTQVLNQKLLREPPRLRSLLVHAMAPKRQLSVALPSGNVEPRFLIGLQRLARAWMCSSRTRAK